jgi:hypothetical protein
MGCRRLVRPTWLVCTALALLGCGRGDAPPSETRDTDTSQPAVASDAPSDWVEELGQLLVVQSDSENTGIILFPETPSSGLISASPLLLLSPSGDSVMAEASLVQSDSQVCGEAPTVRLRGNVPSWSVGLHARSAAALRMDSIETLASADSARFAAELARLASTVPTARESRFGGLPFVVLTARRFELPGSQAVVAHLVRRLPQEATPLEEHTLLVAERPAAATQQPYGITYQQRSEGTEETADHFDILAAVRGGRGTFLLIARDREARTRYEVLVRTPSGWRLRWQRTLAC